MALLNSECNVSLCYNSALPGLISPNDNAGGSGDGTTGVVSDINEAGTGTTTAASTMAYTDPNGDINVKIAGPFEASEDDIDDINFQVFISKENAREKFAVFKHSGFGKTIESDTPITPSIAVIYSELDEDNPEICYYYLKIRYQDLILARGTYVVRVYKETEQDSGEFVPLKAFTLTVKSDPIQGPHINKKYIDTNNRLVNFYEQGRTYW